MFSEIEALKLAISIAVRAFTIDLLATNSGVVCVTGMPVRTFGLNGHSALRCTPYLKECSELIVQRFETVTFVNAVWQIANQERIC